MLVGGLALYLLRAVVRPVRRTGEMARRLAGGDLSVRMPGSGAGEVGVLGRSFNTMAASLEAGREELRLLAREQAALRRIATLVAHGVGPEEVVTAVTAEVHELLRADATVLVRYEADRSATVLAARDGTAPGDAGEHWSRDAADVAAAVLHARGPVSRRRGTGTTGPAGTAAAPALAGSAAGAPIVLEDRTWGAIVVLWDRREEPGADLRTRLAEFTGLVATAIANAQSRAELADSRARIVAAADEARRRIERDLHDGAQQRLVALGLELRAAQAMVGPEGAELGAQLARVAQGLAAASDELRELARGIHPAILSRGGLLPALRALARRSPVPVELELELPVETRLPDPVEVAAYFAVSEALANTAKHARASVVGVTVGLEADALRITVRDDGRGGADPRRGSGLVGLRDRIEALGGTLQIVSPPGAGTTITMTIPTGALGPRDAAGAWRARDTRPPPVPR